MTAMARRDIPIGGLLGYKDGFDVIPQLSLVRLNR